MADYNPDQSAEPAPEPTNSSDALDRSRSAATRGLSRRLRSSSSPDSPAGEDKPRLQSAQDGSKETPSRQGPALDKSLETRVVSSQSRTGQHAEGLLSVGMQLQRRYKILGVIGVGGMGAVYKAQDLRFSGVVRLCAVKEMINTASDAQVREMIIRNFEREASILATLSHPAIPQVHDFFTEGSRSYLVLEFIQGQDLEVHVSEAAGFFAETQVVDWAVQLCDVLSFLHNHKPRPIIFRDLKPSNIMLDDHNRIRLVDFGIAKLFESGEKGTMIGTEGYSPPEQYRGIAEPRGDVYALGATLHHLLSKQDPRLEPPFSFQERPIHQTNPTVSRELQLVVDKALAYDLNVRWGSAEELKRALLSLPAAKGLSSTEKGHTASINSRGVKPIWRFACEDEVRGSVSLAGELLLVPSYDHNVYALQVDGGDFAWKYAAEGGVASSPCVWNGLAVFGSTDRVIYALDLRDGRLRWTLPTRGKVYSSPYPAFGHFFVGSDDGHLYAIQGQSGRKAWEFVSDSAIRSRPFVNDELVTFSCDLGLIYALTLNRDLRWRFRTRRGLLSSPVPYQDHLYIGSLDWNFYALDSRSGLVAWTYRTGGAIASTAGVWEDLVIFGSADGHIYALDTSDGRLVWRYATEGQVTGSTTISEGAVYIGGVDGGLYCLDVRSGNLRWRYQTDGPVTGAPQVADGFVYFGSGDHYVYALPA